MFHNVLTVEYMLKMRKYTNANYITGMFVNFALFIGCVIVSFMRLIYVKINPGSVAVGVEYCFLVKQLWIFRSPLDKEWLYSSYGKHSALLWLFSVANPTNALP